MVRSRPWGHTVLRCRAGLLRGLDAGLSPGLISFVGTAVVLALARGEVLDVKLINVGKYFRTSVGIWEITLVINIS